MPNIPGGNTKNAEGAQGMSTAGDSNVFPFQGEPTDPDLYDGYDLPLVATDNSLDPPGGRTTLKNHQIPQHPLW